MATGHDGDDPGPSGDRIRLVLPADPAYGRIARIAVSSVALRLGVPYAAVEDLRLAVDETIILLLRPEAGADAELTGGPSDGPVDGPTDGATPPTGPAELTVELTVAPHELAIEVALPASDGAPAANQGATSDAGRTADPGARRRFEEIVTGTVDGYEVADDERSVRLHRRF